MLNKFYNLFLRLPVPLQNVLYSAVRLFLDTKKYKTPEFIIFFVTNRCNADCAHCFYRAGRQQILNLLPLENIKKIIASLVNRNKVLITGGEPFTRPDIFEIVQEFFTNGKTKKIQIASNGFFTDKIIEFCEKAKKYNWPIKFQISLDYVGVEHDEFRRLPGLFQRAVDTIGKINELSKEYPELGVTALATVTKNNIDKLAPLRELLKNKTGVELEYAIVRDPRYGIFNVPADMREELTELDSEQLLPDEQEIARIINNNVDSERDLRTDLIRLCRKIELNVVFKKEKTKIKCLAGYKDCVIYPNGDVSACEITKPFANLSEFNFDLHQLWNSEKAARTRKRISCCFCNHPCHIASSLQGQAETIKMLRDL